MSGKFKNVLPLANVSSQKQRVRNVYDQNEQTKQYSLFRRDQ